MQLFLTSKLSLLIVTVLAVLGVASISAQQRKLSAEQLLNSGAVGTEFWITVPPNEINPYSTVALEVYVASAFDTEIEVLDVAKGVPYKRTLKSYEIRTLSDKRGETNWTWEVREQEQPVNKAIRITSKKPISVYVLNAKTYTSDGYMALPVSSWDKEYIAAAYYDFREFNQWAGGFVIVAREQCKVDILLRGTGKGSATTSMGRMIGDRFTINLDEGDVYMIHGDGQTRGEFDLTGTSISSDKPIGVIGFHMRTTMPNLLVNGNGRNHLVEMLPPLSLWGKRYATVELQRENRGQGKGDVFRVIAKDSNTRWSLTYYDKLTKKILGTGGGILKNAGEFADIAQAGAPTTLTHGYSVWTADKPIFVMQYSCSSIWDGDVILDPFMMNVTPEEQFATSTIFQFPTAAQFSKHRLNLIVKTDTSDPNYIDNLKSLEIDDIPVWKHPAAQSPALLSTKMPNGLHWTILDFGTEPRAHKIKSNGLVSFGGYIYGFGAVDAYGWPITGGKPTAPINTFDTLAPVITRGLIDCHFREYTALEQRNNPNPPRAVPQNGDQIETGIKSIALSSTSRNLELYLGVDSATAFITEPKSFTFRANVVDTTKPASGMILIRDWNDNLAADTLTYSPPIRLDTLPPVIDAKSSLPVLWDFEISDKRNSPDPMPKCPSSTVQVDRGLKLIQFDSLNMRLIRPLQRSFPLGTVTSSLTFEVVDVTKNAWGCVTVFDHAGNSKNLCQQYEPITSIDVEDFVPACIVSYVNNQLVINADSVGTDAHVTVYTIDGQELYSDIVSPHTIYHKELNLSSGVYAVSVILSGRPPLTCSFVVF